MQISKHREVCKAAEDLERHTLAGIPRALDRLIYLASTRDYNSGAYYHDGLAARFTEEAACQALAECHRHAFRELVGLPLREIVAQIDAYIDSTHTHREELLAAWKKLEPYRVAVPVESDPVLAEFLFSNIRVALAILDSRRKTPPESKPIAWPRQLPAQ